MDGVQNCLTNFPRPELLAPAGDWECVKAAVEKCEADGQVDLYQSVLLPVPASVIAHLLGVPQEDREKFTTWGDELCEIQLEGDNFNKPVGDLHPKFAAYLDRHIAQRKAEGATGSDRTTTPGG